MKINLFITKLKNFKNETGTCDDFYMNGFNFIYFQIRNTIKNLFIFVCCYILFDFDLNFYEKLFVTKICPKTKTLAKNVSTIFNHHGVYVLVFNIDLFFTRGITLLFLKQ